MIKDEQLLPEYPAKSDLWCELREQTRPIVVYGMGNGADKLFCQFEKYGIIAQDIFASDGFVRGHSYRGMRVLSLSEIEEKYEDFVIVVSFASRLAEVIGKIRELDRKYTLYIPDMPIAGEEYFDKDFYNKNYESIRRAYLSLSDEGSRRLFASLVNYKLSGRVEPLFSDCSQTADIYSFLGRDVRAAVDCGAYNGDTAREMIEYFPHLEKIYAIEPDRRNYKKLCRYVSEAGEQGRITTYNAALWSEVGEGAFIGSSNRNSSVNSTASYKNREEAVSLVSLDSLISSSVDYIKYDVEGAEAEALLGSRRVISEFRPSLLISAYHRSEDIFSLINYLKNEYPDYSLYLKRTLCFPAWEISLLAIAKDR